MDELFASSADSCRRDARGEGGGQQQRELQHYGRMSVDLIGVRHGMVGKEYWQEPEWQLANEGYVSLFR